MRDPMHHSKNRIAAGRISVPVAALSLILASAAFAQRTQLKPGWNLFSPDQDVEVGKQAAVDAEKKLPMLNDRRVNDYLTQLGLRLAAKAPGAKYPYQFKAVNDMSINAFALPGGFLFVNRGTIEAADDEAQLAGVIGHEIAHVALRHGTNQASKAYIAQAPLVLLGGLGSNSVGTVLAKIGAGFTLDSVLLKYSRDAENQADIMGTQILYDCGYDPRAMEQFFEKLTAEGGSRTPQFFNSHPNPENRMEKINEEISRLGGTQPGAATDLPGFHQVRDYVRRLPQPKPAAGGSQTASAQPGTTQPGAETPPKPSSRLTDYSNDLLQLRYPDNWGRSGSDQSTTLAPDHGTVATSQGESLAYGMILSVFAPNAGQSGRFDLKEATDQLIADLQRSNPNMRVSGTSAQTRVGGEKALSTTLRNDSPVGGTETDWLVTVLRPDGLVYFIGVAPEPAYNEYRRVFQKVLDSVRYVSR